MNQSCASLMKELIWRDTRFARCGCTLFFALLMNVGCGIHKPTLPPAPAIVTQRSGPVELRLTREAFDGQDIWLEGDVDFYGDVPAESIALQLSVFGGGALLRDQRFFLCGTEWVEFLSPDCVNRRDARNGSVPFVIRGEGAGGKDYQLGVLWGADAQAVKPRAILRTLRTESSLPDCSLGHCTVFYTLVGEIVNMGGKPLRGVTLGVRFIDSNAPEGSAAREASEEDVPLDVAIAQGATTSFRLVVDQPVPLELVGRVRPVVRLREVNDG